MKKALYFLLLSICFLLGCNKKFYQSITEAKEAGSSSFVILKSGEKINIEGAKMLSNGTITSINKLAGEKGFNKDDIAAIQNKSGFYKKFLFSANRTVKQIKEFSHDVSYNNERFAVKYKNGAINKYEFIGDVNYRNSTGATAEAIIFHIYEIEATKEFAIYYWETRPDVGSKIENWVSKSTRAIKLINEWKALTQKKKEKYNGDPYEKAVDLFNEDFTNGNLEK